MSRRSRKNSSLSCGSDQLSIFDSPASMLRAYSIVSQLRGEGFSDHIIEAVRSVTKRDDEDYEAFVQRAAANPIGRRVKLADLHDNCDISRIVTPSERDLERIEKYRRAIDLIGRQANRRPGRDADVVAPHVERGLSWPRRGEP